MSLHFQCGLHSLHSLVPTNPHWASYKLFSQTPWWRLAAASKNPRRPVSRDRERRAREALLGYPPRCPQARARLSWATRSRGGFLTVPDRPAPGRTAPPAWPPRLAVRTPSATWDAGVRPETGGASALCGGRAGRAACKHTCGACSLVPAHQITVGRVWDSSFYLHCSGYKSHTFSILVFHLISILIIKVKSKHYDVCFLGGGWWW